MDYIDDSNCLEIDLDAIEYNFKEIKNKLSNGTKMCMVLKSNAYGHGAVKLAKLYEDLGADFFAIARTREGLELRKNNIKLPILNLGYSNMSSIEPSIKEDISMTIFRYEFAEKINEVAKKLNKKAKVHIKLDTGMSRLGYVVLDDRLDEITNEIKK